MGSNNLIIGLGAGLVSTLLHLSIAGGSPLSIVLFFLNALPLFLCAFGWGVSTAATAAFASFVLITLAAGPAFSVNFAVTIAAPTLWLSHLAMLSRPIAPADAGAPAQVEWYPTSRLILWTALISGVLVSLNLMLLGPDLESYNETLSKFIDERFITELKKSSELNLTEDQIKTTKDFALRIFPALSAIVWFLSSVLNLVLAIKIAEISGRLTRPKLNFAQMSYPLYTGLGFVGCIFATALPDMLGLIASAFVGVFYVAFLILGLAIIHSIIPQGDFRPIVLFVIYATLIWTSMFVVFVGLSDPVFQLRNTFKGNSPPPDE